MKEQFQLVHQDTIHKEAVGIRPGNIVVAVRDYNTLYQLKWILERTDTREQDVVVMSARLTPMSAGSYDLAMEQIFSDYEQTLFTRAVAVAEKVGRRVSLLVVPARDPWSACVQTVQSLESATARVAAGKVLPPVVLSTDTYEDQFWEKAAPLREAGVAVFRRRF